MEIVLDARDSLYYQGARAVQVLQQEYPGIGSSRSRSRSRGLCGVCTHLPPGPGLLSVSSWGDPSQGFLLYFPIILSLRSGKGPDKKHPKMPV